MTKEEFLKNIDDWSNHRLLLWDALEVTKNLGLPVLELGCGNGSTPYLQQYCKDNKLVLRSYDFNKEWAEKFGAKHVTNWDEDVNWNSRYAVVLVDESPGEHRKESLRLLSKHAMVIVCHDSEPPLWNASDYQVRPLLERFIFLKDIIPEEGKAWATAVSNFLDLNDIYHDLPTTPNQAAS